MESTRTKERKLVGASPVQSRARALRAPATSYGVKILAFLVILLAVGILVFIGFKAYRSFSYTDQYTIDLNPELFRDESSPLYVNEDLNEEKFGQGGVVNGEHYFEIIGSPLEFVWQPEEFPLKKDITVSALLKGEAKLELGIPCEECGEEKYRWETFHDPLGSASAVAAAFEKTVGTDYEKGSVAEIKTELTGSQIFYVYLEDKLDLSVTKKSFNPFGIERDITVELADLEGKTAWEEKIPYVTDEESSFRFEAELEEKGIYKLSITNPQDDFVITKLSINTNKIAPADTILSAINSQTNKDSWIVAEKHITEEGIKDKKAIHFLLRNPDIEKKKNNELTLVQRGFSIAQKFGDFLIWKRDDALPLGIVVPDEQSTLGEFLDLAVPAGGTVEGNKEFGIAQEIPDGFSAEPTTISADLRGNHSFYLFLSDSLKSDIKIKELNWYEGADDINVILSTKNGEKLCQKTILDDGNTSSDKIETNVPVSFECNNLSDGVYVLSFEEKTTKKDYVIKELSVNTNKIVAKGGVLNLSPLSLYTNSTLPKDIKFYYWHDNLDQDILLRSIKEELPRKSALPEADYTLTLTKEDKGREVFYTLQGGLWEILPSKGNLVISNSDFAFSPEHWFEVEPDYIVTEKADKDAVTLKNITITVK